MEICVKLPPHSISYLYPEQTDRQTDSEGLAACLQELKSLLNPRRVENAWGLWLVTDIKRMTKKICACLSMHYMIIYSTNTFHLRMTHGDRKRKTGRETKPNNPQHIFLHPLLFPELTLRQ